MLFWFVLKGEMGPKGEPGISGNRGPTGRPGKRGKQVMYLWTFDSSPYQYLILSYVVCVCAKNVYRVSKNNID